MEQDDIALADVHALSVGRGLNLRRPDALSRDHGFETEMLGHVDQDTASD